MFQIGEYVVHGNDGICEVKDITQLELPGGSSKRQYYLLVPQKEKNGRIYSPVESSKVQTRKVITKQEADTLIREIPAIQAAWVENEKLRENVYKEAIKSCDLRELVKIIKNMYLRRQERSRCGICRISVRGRNNYACRGSGTCDGYCHSEFPGRGGDFTAASQ